jgi:hypothetical protein
MSADSLVSYSINLGERKLEVTEAMTSLKRVHWNVHQIWLNLPSIREALERCDNRVGRNPERYQFFEEILLILVRNA